MFFYVMIKELMSSSSSESKKKPNPGENTNTASGHYEADERTSIVNFGGGSQTKVTKRQVPLLQITAGEEQGRIIALGEKPTFTMGRSKECDLALQDSTCSRKHAEITVSAQGPVFIKDFGSTNGTKVNGERLQKDPIRLNDGDRIQLGDNTILRFSLVAEEDAKAQMDVYVRATRDPLTNACNRRLFQEALVRELSFHNRGGSGMGLIIFDVDFFKKINDGFGHPTGDEVLREIGRRIPPLIRKEDLFARIGGEEFALIIRNEKTEGAYSFAERLRKTIEATPVVFENRSVAFTISVGLCFLDKAQNSATPDQLVQTADAALYEAKQTGRNRVVVKSLQRNS